MKTLAEQIVIQHNNETNENQQKLLQEFINIEKFCFKPPESKVVQRMLKQSYNDSRKGLIDQERQKFKDWKRLKAEKEQQQIIYQQSLVCIDPYSQKHRSLRLKILPQKLKIVLQIFDSKLLIKHDFKYTPQELSDRIKTPLTVSTYYLQAINNLKFVKNDTREFIQQYSERIVQCLSELLINEFCRMYKLEGQTLLAKKQLEQSDQSIEEQQNISLSKSRLINATNLSRQQTLLNLKKNSSPSGILNPQNKSQIMLNLSAQKPKKFKLNLINSTQNSGSKLQGLSLLSGAQGKKKKKKKKKKKQVLKKEEINFNKQSFHETSQLRLDFNQQLQKSNIDIDQL
eukprot:403339593